MNHNKTIFYNTGYQIIGKILTSLLGFIGILFLTRYLTAIQFSEYSTIINYSALAAIFGDLGLSSLLTRKIASGDYNKETIPLFFTLRLIFSFIFFAIFVVLSFLFPYSATIRTGIVIASFYNLIILLSSILWSVFQAKMKFGKIVIAQSINSFVLIILILTGVKMNFGLQFFILANVVASLVCFLITYKLLGFNQLLIKFNLIKFVKIIKKVWPFAFGVVVSVAYFKIDSIILSFFYSPSKFPDVGLYSLSYRFFEVAIVFGGLFAQTLYPFFSKHILSDDFMPIFKRYLIYCFLISVASVILIFTFSNLLVGIFGVKYVSSASSLQILSLASGVTILAGFFLSVALAGRKEVLIVKFSAIVLVINLILNLIFIPRYSFIGASWTTLTTQTLILIFNGIIAYQVINNIKLKRLSK